MVKRCPIILIDRSVNAEVVGFRGSTQPTGGNPTTVIRPYYQQKFAVLEAGITKYMPKDLPWFLHRGEGAIFGWMWFQDLPITDWELYQALKQVGVIVVPGNSFFPGLREDWVHKQQCIRISLTASDEDITIAMERLAKVVVGVYGGK